VQLVVDEERKHLVALDLADQDLELVLVELDLGGRMVGGNDGDLGLHHLLVSVKLVRHGSPQ
jgi:hypothetical protein